MTAMVNSAQTAQLTPLGIAEYDTAIRRFNEWNQGRPINGESVRLFLDGLRGRYAAATINLYRWALKRAVRESLPEFQSLEARARLDHYFRTEIRPLKVDQSVRNALTPNEIGRLMREAEPRTGAFVRFLYVSAMRISEALHVRIRDCRRTGPRIVTIHVRHAKGRKERRVRIPSTLYEQVRTTFQSDVFLLQNHHRRSQGGRFSAGFWHNVIKSAGKEILGRNDLHCHLLRHSAATNLLVGGATLKAVGEHLGHSSPIVTARFYDHSSVSDDAILNLEIEAEKEGGPWTG